MNNYITMSDDAVISMEDSTGNIIVSIDVLPKDSKDNDEIIIHYVEDTDNVGHKYHIINFDSANRRANLKWLSQINNIEDLNNKKIITESPVIKLDQEDIVDPSDAPLKRAVSRSIDRAEKEKAAELKRENEQRLKTKYSGVADKLNASIAKHDSAITSLEVLFDELVPAQGIAETVAGEHVRAIMRILYRDANDGDKFFEGYGLETCGSSAEYLFDNGFAEEIQNIIDNAYQLSSDDDKYTAALENLAASVVNKIKNNAELLYTPNETDSREYSADYIKENQPTYEIELPASDDVIFLVENGVLTSWDLIKYVESQLEWEHDYVGAEVSRPWSHHDTSVTVENLTKDGYDRLSDSFNHDSDAWWEDLVSDYADELSQIQDDIDDDYDSAED